MVLFISSWVRPSHTPATVKDTPPMDSPSLVDIAQPSSRCSHHKSSRTPYWEWIRSNSSGSPLGTISSSSSLSDETSEDEDDYAFYYAHPERIVYHNHAPMFAARRRLRKDANTRRKAIRSNQHERDSLATMVEPNHDVDFYYDFDDDAVSMSSSSLGSEDTAAEEEQPSEPPKDKNASTSAGPQVVDGATDLPPAARLDNSNERRRLRKSRSDMTTATPSSYAKTLTTTRASGTKGGHEDQRHSPPAHDGVRLRKSLSRLSIFRIFNSERTPQ